MIAVLIAIAGVIIAGYAAIGLLAAWLAHKVGWTVRRVPGLPWRETIIIGLIWPWATFRSTGHD